MTAAQIIVFGVPVIIFIALVLIVSDNQTTKMRALYTFLVFLILVTSACVWGFGLDGGNVPQIASGAGVLGCAMFILHKRLN
jgi:hypothetical protein